MVRRERWSNGEHFRGEFKKKKTFEKKRKEAADHGRSGVQGSGLGLSVKELVEWEACRGCPDWINAALRFYSVAVVKALEASLFPCRGERLWQSGLICIDLWGWLDCVDLLYPIPLTWLLHEGLVYIIKVLDHGVYVVLVFSSRRKKGQRCLFVPRSSLTVLL